MTHIETVENSGVMDAAEFCSQVLSERVKEASDSLYTASKDKYDQKTKIIENATDMTTEEKLEALDRNYGRHTQEVWQGILVFGAIGLGVIGLVVGNPTIVKNVRRLIFQPMVRNHRLQGG